MSTTTITNAVEALAQAVGEHLGPEGEHLVYVDYSDRLMDDQVDLLVAGGLEDDALLDDHLAEWYSENQHHGACLVVDDAAKDVVNAWKGLGLTDEQADDLLEDFEYSEEREEVVMNTRDLDKSDPIRDLAEQTPAVLCRVPIPGLGEGDWYPRNEGGYTLGELDTMDEVDNLGELREAIAATTSPEHDVTLGDLRDLVAEVPSMVYMGYWLFAVRPADLLDFEADDVVEVDAFILMGNPFTGGYAESDGTFKARIRRGDMRTDRDAFGYSWTETAGPVVSYYETGVTGK